jgi:photosystem II stability/assembly factor-like uncharacterized protein
MPIIASAPGRTGQGQDVYMAANPAVNVCAPPVAALERLSKGAWQQVHLWQLGFVTALDWPAGSTGYAIVSGAMARTTDAGQAWRQAWPLLVPSGPLALLPGGRAVGTEDASSGGAVLESADGGRSWSQRAELPGAVSALAFSSPETGLVALDELLGHGWAVAGTTDGGWHWSVLWRVPFRPSAVDYQGISGLWTASESDGLMVTTSGNSAGDPVGVAPAALWATSDGGRDWRKVAAVPTNDYWVSGALAFYRDDDGAWHGFVQGGGQTVGTTNTGQSWHVEPQVPTLMQVQYLSGTVIAGWQMGAGQTPWLWLSTNGGQHWTRRPLPPAGLHDLAGHGTLRFSGDGVGLWVEGGRLWATSDLGRHWREIAGS